MENGIDFTKMTKAEKDFIRKATHYYNFWADKGRERDYTKSNEEYHLIEFDVYGVYFYGSKGFVINIYFIIHALSKKIKVIGHRCDSYELTIYSVIERTQEVFIREYICQRCHIQISECSWNSAFKKPDYSYQN